MSKSKSKKELEINIAVPDGKHLKHIADAYGLVCQYRTAQKVPHEKMESWLLRLVIEGCNAIYNFHNQNLLKQEEAAKAKKETEKTTETKDLTEITKEMKAEEVSE